MEDRESPRSGPRIAVVMRNTLAACGLASLVESVMPMADVRVYGGVAEIGEENLAGFVHFFISTEALTGNLRLLAPFGRRIIVITEGEDGTLPPDGFRTIDATLDSRQLLREFLKMEQAAHGGGRGLPEEVRQKAEAEAAGLTPRETEVLRELVRGNINKEAADRLGISPTTVITHRRNIMAKLHAKSLASLAVYAVTHGIVSADEI